MDGFYVAKLQKYANGPKGVADDDEEGSSSSEVEDDDSEMDEEENHDSGVEDDGSGIEEEDSSVDDTPVNKEYNHTAKATEGQDAEKSGKRKRNDSTEKRSKAK